MKIKLKVLRGKSAGKEIPIPAPRFLIGRSNDCHLRPKSDSISRNHCTILTRGNQVWIRDLNSRNGTFVNGERITEEEEIKDGDQLQIGKLEFSVVVKESKKAPLPTVELDAKDDAATKLGSTNEEPDSLDFDVTEWLQETEGGSKTAEDDPETRQFQLDDTDRMAVSKSEPEEEAEPTGGTKAGKRKPGKLPSRPIDKTDSSRDAAADMLKKFFNSR